MSTWIYSITEAVQRINSHDSTLEWIYLFGENCTDQELDQLIDCLLVHPDIVPNIDLGCNQLTNESGLKLARYLATSSTIQTLLLSSNEFSEPTYLALAAALRINTSLRVLDLQHNQGERKNHIEAAFVDALILNPIRPTESNWCLYSWNDFDRLKTAAEQWGHPSLQAMLATQLVRVT